MALPFTYPKSDGPGRLTEICSFRKSKLPAEQFDKTYAAAMEAMGMFPISRQSALLEQFNDPEIAVLVADWTSAEEKDQFEPGERYQSLKPSFMTLIDAENPTFACHHVILPGFAETPICDWYTISHLKIPWDKQAAVAEAFEAYVKDHTAEDLVFLTVAVSREEAETVVVHSGHKQEKNATMGVQSPEHERVKARLAVLVESGTKYAAKLKSTRAMTN